MARFRSNLRPINRIKHVVDVQKALAVATLGADNLAQANDDPILANTEEVLTGSTINAVYLKVEIIATSSAALPNVYMMVVKNPGSNLTFPNPNVVGASDNKKYVIHQEMLMLQKQTGSNPRTLFNGVILLPRGYRRFGPQDGLSLRVFAPGITVEYCFQCHYKEFR